MATDSFVQIAQDSSGKRIDNSQVAIGGFDMQRQRVNISDPSTAAAHAAVMAADPVAGDFGLVTRPVSLGVAADAKVLGDTAGTISAKLRGLLSIVTATFDAAISTLANQVTLDLVKTNTDNLDVTLSTRTKPSDTQIATLGNSTGKTRVMKTGQLTTVAVTANQVVLTYTVTALKTFYLQYVNFHVRKTTVPVPMNVDPYGTISLEIPSGAKVITEDMVGVTGFVKFDYEFSEPIPIAAGVVIRIVCTPAVATSFLWNANFGGFEK